MTLGIIIMMSFIPLIFSISLFVSLDLKYVIQDYNKRILKVKILELEIEKEKNKSLTV